MAAATVRQLLDQLAAGTVTVGQVAADFKTRRWPAQVKATEAQVHGAADTDMPDDNSWATVDADSRLTGDVYATLAAAHSQAPGT